PECAGSATCCSVAASTWPSPCPRPRTVMRRTLRGGAPSSGCRPEARYLASARARRTKGMTPAVSIGLPFHDAAATLPDAIRSIFAQSFEDWELLLVDDGSNDGSLACARSIRDPRVSVHSDGVNRQLSYRLNQIASLARGEYLARMDADDLMHPDRLALQVQRLRERPAIDVLGTAACAIDASARPLGIRGERPPGPSVRSVLHDGGFVHPSVIARAAWFREHPYDPSYVRAEDLELWCRTVDH